MAPERHIVVTGGGGFWCGDDGLALDDFALSLTGKARPRVCYLAHASGDDPTYIEGFYDRLGPRCDPSHLTLFRTPAAPPAELLGAADVVYVGGGSTPNLLALWRVHGIDELLREAWERGVVLCGGSAGGLCWFESGVTDSSSLDGTLRAWHDGLGLLPGSHAPHYDSEPERRPTYQRLVGGGTLPAGYAADDFAALHFVGTEPAEVVAAVPGAGAYRVERAPGEGDGVRETVLEARLLG